MTNTHEQKDLPGTAEADGADAAPPIALLVYPAKPGRTSRRFRGTDEIDAEYAAEFEDAFYGEGM